MCASGRTSMSFHRARSVSLICRLEPDVNSIESAHQLYLTFGVAHISNLSIMYTVYVKSQPQLYN